MNFYTIFREKEGLLKAKFEKLKEQLTVVLRLFVIMGIRSALRIEIEFFIAGVPWVLDLVATVISHEYSIDKTCYLRIFINIFNSLGTYFYLPYLGYVSVTTCSTGNPDISGNCCKKVSCAELEGESCKLYDKKGHQLIQQYKGEQGLMTIQKF